MNERYARFLILLLACVLIAATTVEKSTTFWRYGIAEIIVKRIRATDGTALVAGDFVLSAGFGNTASAGTITGTDQRWQATFTSSGTGQAANPTITLTFKDGTWSTTPIYWLSPNGGTGTGCAGFTWLPSATQLVITCVGTPIATETYILVGGTLG